MKILQVSTKDYGGGAEKSAWSLFLKYRELGETSWLAVGQKLSNDSNVFEIPNIKKTISWNHKVLLFVEKRLSHFGTNSNNINSIRKSLHRINSGLITVEGLFHTKLGIENFSHPGTWKFLQSLPSHPDIIHLHNLHGNYFDLRYLPTLSRKYPVILNLRDMWTLTGHCALPMGCPRWKVGCGNCPDLTIYPPIRRDATRFNYRRKKTIFSKSRLYIATPSQWLMNIAKESGMFEPIEYKLIPNAIDLHTFQPGNKLNARQLLDIPANASVVLMIAHSQFRDFKTMQSAVERLKRHGSPLLFICIGKNGVTQHLGEGEMIYVGKNLEPSKVALYYQAADVYIHAAFNESFGKTIVEAMSCAIPVVASAVDAIPELIADGETGFLIPSENDELMATRIQYLLDHPGKAEEIGRKASFQTRQKYNLDNQVDTFLNWYRDILSSSHYHPEHRNDNKPSESDQS